MDRIHPGPPGTRLIVRSGHALSIEVAPVAHDDRSWSTADHIAKPREIPRVPETPIWTLTKDTRTAIAAERPHPRGVELIIRVNDRLIRSDAFRLDQRAELDRLIADTREAFTALGWV